MQDDQFDVDAEPYAACAVVQFQQFLTRLEWQFRDAVTCCGLAVLLGIAGLTGECQLAVLERRFGQWLEWLEWQHTAAAGMADTTLAGQCG